MQRLLSFLFLCTLPTFLFAQAYNTSAQAPNYLANIQHISVNQGLHSRHVYCFQEDSKGFMWIGTKNGLHRYDGYEFKIFTKEKNNLSLNSVRAIVEDNKEKLWVFESEAPGMNGIEPSAIDIIDLATFEIKSFEKEFGYYAPFGIADIFKVFTDKDIIFFSTKSGALYQYKDNAFNRLFQIPTKDQRIYEVLHSPNNTIWFKSSEDTLREINYKGDVLHSRYLPFYANNLVHVDSNNQILIKNPTRWGRNFYRTLAYLSPEGKFEPIALNPKDIPINLYDFFLGEVAYDEKRHMLWFAGNGKLFTLDLASGKVHDFSKSFSEYTTVGYTTLFYFDRDDNVWIGSSAGFFVIQLKQNKFTRFLHNQKGINDQYHSTRAIVSDNAGHIMVNSYAGLRLVNVQTGVSVPFNFEKTPTNYQVTNFLSILKDKEGHWWFGSGDGQLVYDAPDQEKWYDLRLAYPFEAEEIWSLYEDEQKRIWLGTNKGMFYIDRDEDRINRMRLLPNYGLLHSSQVVCFYEEAKDKVWICTNTGLYLWNPYYGVMGHFSSQKTGKNYLPHDMICHIQKDSSGIYWLATKGGGLIEWNKEEGKHKQYTTADGLSHNVLYAVYEDEKEGLWLASNEGLMRFDKLSNAVNLYLPRDGITHEEFNTNSHFKADDGRIYFGSLDGINAFYPNDFYTRTKAGSHTLHITEFLQQDGRSGEFIDKTLEINNTKGIQLPPSDKSFILKVALLDYIHPEQHIYAYKIDGLDNDWTFQKRNDIRLNSLPYGNHTLKIKAQGSDGLWSSEELNIPVKVPKPIFMQPWFLASSILLALAICIIIITRRTRRLKKERAYFETEVNRRTETIRKQAEELKTLDSQKSRFFANVSHELRTPLTLILGPLSTLLKRDYLQDEDIVSLLLMQKNAKQLLRQVNEILDLSKLDSNKLEIHENIVELNSFVSKLVASYESYAQQQGLTINLVYQGETSDYILIDKEKVSHILNNLISNAIKFTAKGGQIDIAVYSWNKTIQIQVKDNGFGISEEDLPKVFDRYFQSGNVEIPIQGGTGIGLALSKELTQLMKGNLKVESTIGKGSIFTLDFPKKVPNAHELLIANEGVANASPDSDHGVIPHPTSDKLPGATILIVEDHPDMRIYMESVLSPRYNIITAENGNEAIKYLEKGAKPHTRSLLPDLILSDVMMPVMDGFTLMKKVKAEEKWRSIPMVMLTAKGDQGMKLQALRFGVDDYLLKPFNEEELLARIHNLLNNYKNRKMWTQQEFSENSMEGNEENPKANRSDINNTQPLISVEDQEWLKQLEQISIDNIGDYGFGIERLSDQIALSQRQLFRKVRQLTGMTPKKYIQELRFQKARQLLENKTYSSVKAVVYAIGMKDVKYFSQKFKERFGKLPSSYL